MGGRSNPYEYVVERDPRHPQGPEVRLVRYERRRGVFGSRRGATGTVMFHRNFKPIGELNELERYASMLDRVAQHASDGTFGCFVETASRGGDVEVTLYERWFGDGRLHCDQLAQRTFDASDTGSLIASAEFRAEIERWAEEQNARREAVYLDAASDEELRAEQAAERAAAANELAGILARRA